MSMVKKYDYRSLQSIPIDLIWQRFAIPESSGSGSQLKVSSRKRMAMKLFNVFALRKLLNEDH